ncbi:MAG: hypothetical protein JWN96_4262 [Mycobacterium sp.]|nr:hypothetical protein [Mycobacterium sp.]
MSDQTEAAGKKLSGLAEDAATQVKDQAEAVIASIASSEQVAKAKTSARKVRKQAAKKSLELSEEAAARGKKAARHASEEAKKRGQAAIASAPAVAASARKSAAKKSEHALEVARERGGELLLSALETDPGKRLANTQAGGALKTKLTRKRRRRKIALLLALNGAGAVAFKQLRARKSESASASSYDVGVPASTPPTETVAPGSTGTAGGDPLTGVVEETVTESPAVAEQSETPAVAATEDGELTKKKDDAG